MPASGAALLLLFSLAMAAVSQSAAQDPVTGEVGMPITLRDLVLPGSVLDAKAIDFKAPVVVSVRSAFKHGAAFRYDIDCYGLEPGEYDLRDWLQRRDGSSTEDLPPLPFTVKSILPAGQVKPHALHPGEVSGIGGYRTLLVMGGTLWLAGLAALVFYRRRRVSGEAAGGEKKPRTLAERLRPMVVKALGGTLSLQERAELELALVAYWRRRLGLEEREPVEVLAELKQHAEAGPLLLALEEWLHRPRNEAAAETPDDLERLLAPYQEVADEELEPARTIS
ncbi:MAG: hypothetical protein AB1486_24190 [Planctomycetota bacterium]